MGEEKEIVELQVFASSNDFEISQVCAILEDNNITYIVKNDGSGAYMNLYLGQSIQEKRIFVSNAEYDKAIEVISTIISDNNYENTTEKEQEQIEDNDEYNNKYTFARRSLGFLIFGVPIISLLLGIAFGIML